MTSTVFTDIDWNKDGKQIGTLNLPHSPDDDAWGVIPFPAASIKNGKGPVVVVTGAVHGDEYEGPIVISELMRSIEAHEVAGQLILLPTFNAPMQGTAADLIKLSMMAVQAGIDKEQRKSKVIMQVHDELVFEVPEDEVEWLKVAVPKWMAEVAALKVPLLAEVGVGLNWDQAH